MDDLDYKKLSEFYNSLVFKSKNNLIKRDSEAYISIFPYFKIIADLLPTEMYILDYTTDKYLYVGKNAKKILGFSQEEHLEGGRYLSLSRIHPDDLKVYSSELFKKFIQLSKSIPKENVLDCRFSICLRMKHKDGRYLKILQQFVILETTEEGIPVISMGIMSNVTSHISSDKVVFSISKVKNGFCETVFSSENETRKIKTLSSREHEVLQAIVQGNSSKTIAEKLFLSLHTVNSHRRNLLKKTHSKNTNELIQFAIQHGIT